MTRRAVLLRRLKVLVRSSGCSVVGNHRLPLLITGHSHQPHSPQQLQPYQQRYKVAATAPASCNPWRSFSSSGNGDDDKSLPSSLNSDNDKNSFRILGIPQNFAVDLKELKQNYLTLMNQHHPDRNPQRDKGDDDDSTTATASIITNAYDQLLNPHLRAVHLLELLGNPILEGEGRSGLVDMEFLARVMEIREQIDSILRGAEDEEDDGSDSNHQEAAIDEALKPLLYENKQRLEETCHDLEQAFQQNDLEQARKLTGHLQYWNRIDETIRERIRNL